jgi:hypothetical protein
MQYEDFNTRKGKYYFALEREMGYGCDTDFNSGK